jgi:phosphoribosyl-ATP pyrophosphohydrolase
VRLEAEPKQGKIVRRIFSMYAEGRSLKYITKKLNEEGGAVAAAAEGKSFPELVSIIGANDSPQRTLSRACGLG